MNQPTSNEQVIDPRWRVYVPREKRNVDGHFVFRTTDGTRYQREASGAIRKMTNVKTGRSKKQRRALRQEQTK